MAGHTYVPRGYSNYPPGQEGGYVYGPEHVNWYVVETTTVERVRGPVTGYTQYGGARFRDVPKYAPRDHYEGYELPYGSEYVLSSPPRHHEGGNFMANFLNKIQNAASRPTKTSNHSSPKKYRPTSPNKYRSTSPDKYHRTSPDKYHRTSPDKYHRTSPNKYRTSSPKNYRPTSPNKYRPPSPKNDRPTSPNKYRPPSPTHNYPSKGAHQTTLPGPNKYRPTSPSKYRSTSPTHGYPSKEDQLTRPKNVSGPNKYQPTSSDPGFPSKEGQPIRIQNLSGPNKHYPSSLSPGDRHIRAPDFSGPNNHWLSEGPPTTRHPLTAPTNDIDEALSYLAISVNHSPRSDLNRGRAFDNMPPRAQPIDHERRYPRSTFGGGTHRYVRPNVINSQEAVTRYNGAFVPN